MLRKPRILERSRSDASYTFPAGASVPVQPNDYIKTKVIRMGMENAVISNGGQQALRDMVELQMYLVAQVYGKSWPLLPRNIKPLNRGPHCDAVDFSVATELLDRGFIERTSSQTFVVSKSGCDFYLRVIKIA